MSEYTINLKQWTDFTLPLIVRNPSPDGGITPGTPINLTGATAEGSVFKGYKAPTRYPLQFTFDPDLTTGQVTASMAAASTGPIPYGLYRFELRVMDSLNHTIFYLEGPAPVVAGQPPNER